MDIKDRLTEKSRLLAETLGQPDLAEQLERAASALIQAGKEGHMVFGCGNGGSASTAEQLVTELVGRFRYERGPLPAMTLTAASLFTALCNDYGYENGYARQISALARRGDVLVSYSTSGNSPNLIEAVRAARAVGATTIGFSSTTGRLKDEVEIAVAVPSSDLTTIEEVHLVLTHLICEKVEEALFGQSGRRIR